MDDGFINNSLRKGEWMQMMDNDDMSLGDLHLSLTESYHLDNDTVLRLVLR